MQVKKLFYSYVYFCPIAFNFVDPEEDCPKCGDYDGGECPFYQESKLNRREIEKWFAERSYEAEEVRRDGGRHP